MNRKICFLFIFILLSACGNNSKDATRAHQENSTLDNEDPKDTSTERAVAVDWSNPVLIGTASFGNIINVNYKVGNFDKLYRLTNHTLKERLRKEEIINKYRKLPLGFDLGFPINKTVDQDTIWLHYKVDIQATKKIMRMPVIIENDTCRLLLDIFEKELSFLVTN